MAEGFDWGSLAATVLPAIIGGITGAGRGGIGAVPGALYGLSSGVRHGVDTEMQREMANRDIALQNQRMQQGQQRIDLDVRQHQAQEERFAAERQRWAIQDRAAEQAMQMQELEMKKNRLQLEEANRSSVGREALRATLSKEEQVLFDADTKSWLQRRDREIRLRGAGGVLEQFGIKGGDELANALGEQGVSHLIGSIVESRNRPRERYGFHYDSATGLAFSYDKTTGAMTSKELGKPKGASPEKISQVESALFRIWKGQNPNMAVAAEQTGDMAPFYEWRTTPEGSLQEKRMYGEISPEEFRGYLGSVKREEQQVEADAITGMRQTAPNMSEADFQNYLKTPKGAQNLAAWRKHVKERGRGQAAPAAAETKNPAAAAAPKKTETSAKDSLLKDFGL